MNSFFNFLMGLFFLSVCFNAQASLTDTYHDQHARGWHWYEANETTPETANASASDPDQQMDLIKKTLKHALNKAVLEPSAENVKQYVTLQQQMTERADQFSKTWKTVLLQEPSLDHSLQVPTNQAARQIYNDQERQNERSAIEKLAKTNGLFFFYRSNCPYCKRFAPVVKSFSERYGISVVPISLDGATLPEFPNSQADQGQAEKFKVTVVPALFTVDPYTHKAIPVSYGLTSEQELRQRIVEIAEKGE